MNIIREKLIRLWKQTFPWRERTIYKIRSSRLALHRLVTDYIPAAPRRIRNWILSFPAAIRGELFVGRCRLYAKKIMADGTTIDYGLVCQKKVTQEFVKHIAYALDGDVGTTDAKFLRFQQYKYHDSGTGVTIENNADVALVTSIQGTLHSPTGRVIATTTTDFSSGTTGNYRSVATVTYSGTAAVTEHALCDAAVAGASEEIMDRSVFTAINVINLDKIEFTYELTINPEAN